jgi:hypothetical protein
MRALKRRLYSKLAKVILVHEEIEYNDFITKASRIN